MRNLSFDILLIALLLTLLGCVTVVKVDMENVTIEARDLDLGVDKQKTVDTATQIETKL